MSDDYSNSKAVGEVFNQPLAPTLAFGTRAQVWGAQDTTSREPHEKHVSVEIKAKIAQRQKSRCHFCGAHLSKLEIHNLNDNHLDGTPANLVAVDSICHSWKHLGEIAEGEGFIAYLPGLTAQDVNHLQRTIMVALEVGSEQEKAEAKKLLNWLASHRSYAENAWGTYSPKAFADALVRLGDVDLDTKSMVFKDLALILNPESQSASVKSWAGKTFASLPVSSWQSKYHSILNAPA